MDLCLDCNSVYGHLIASDLKKPNEQWSEVQAYGTCCFSYTQRLFTFLFSSSSFSPLSFSAPHTSFTFWISFRCPSFPFCHLLCDCLCLLYFVLSPPTVSPSSGSIHSLTPPPDGFSAWVSSVQCHQSCFSPCCLWSSFSLHTGDEASNWKNSQVTGEHDGHKSSSYMVAGYRDCSHVIIWWPHGSPSPCTGTKPTAF